MKRQHAAVFNFLQEQSINENYIKATENIYVITVLIQLHNNTNKIKTVKGDSFKISLKLFTTWLENIF